MTHSPEAQAAYPDGLTIGNTYSHRTAFDRGVAVGRDSMAEYLVEQGWTNPEQIKAERLFAQAQALEDAARDYDAEQPSQQWRDRTRDWLLGRAFLLRSKADA